jgi:GcrA cell cycle regulator
LKILKTTWNDDNNKRVIELAAAGASAARASVALNRSVSAVRIQASKLGTPFLTTRIIRKNQLAKCEAAESALIR